MRWPQRPLPVVISRDLPDKCEQATSQACRFAGGKFLSSIRQAIESSGILKMPFPGGCRGHIDYVRASGGRFLVDPERSGQSKGQLPASWGW